jgi:Domain of unknown function (DUF4394)/Calx-beta domain
VFGALISLIVLAAIPSATQAARLFALTAPPVQLVQVASSLPSEILASTPVSGLAEGETVLGMDVRPADGGLYVLTAQGATGHLRRLDPASGALSAGVTLAADPTDVTSPYTGLVPGVGAGVDFNPVPDRLRIVTATRQNLRVNPATGLVITDADLNPGTPQIVAAAYTNSYSGASATTLYGYNWFDDALVIQNPPNNGTLTTVGTGSGIDTLAPANIGMDIAPLGNVALLDAQVGSVVGLYLVDLTAGTATLLGPLGTGAVQMTDIAAAENLVGFSAAATTASEDRGVAQLTVRRDAPRGRTTVAYSTSDGSATAGADYTGASGTLTFPEGETTRTIEVPLTPDAIDEPDKTFTVALSNPTPDAGTTATLMLASATVTIADDDPEASTAPVDATKPVLLLDATDITRARLRSKGLPFRFSCSEACRLALTLRVGKKQVGSATASLAAAGVRKGRARLTKKGNVAVRRARSLKLSAIATDAAGNRGSDKLTVRLR